MKKSPVAGFLMLSNRTATSEIAAALGIDAVMPGFNWLKAAKRFSFVRAPLISCSACGCTEMLLAVGTKAVLASVRW